MGAWKRFVRRPRLGVALGGGAARGLAHVGVLSVLEEVGLHPDLLAGVSFGALVGATYAHVGSAEEVQRRFTRFAEAATFRDSRLQFFFEETDPNAEGGFFAAVQSMMKRGLFYTAAMRRRGYLVREEFAALIDGLLPDLDMEDLTLPFLAVAADLHTGEAVMLERGPLRESVMASCAIPGVMPPVRLDGRLLVDGGCVNKMPGDALRRRGADVVLGIDVSVYPPMERETKVRGIDVILRGYAIKEQRLRDLYLRQCDVVFHVPMEEVHWADFGRVADSVERGRIAASRALPRLQEALDRARSLRFRARRALRGG